LVGKEFIMKLKLLKEQVYLINYFDAV
jgi:hypothetical protein